MPTVPNWWQDLPGFIREGAEKEASQRSRASGDDPSIGLWGSMWGANAEGAQEYTQKNIDKTGRKQLDAAGAGTTFVPGKTAEQYTEEARAATVARTNREAGESPQGQALTARLDGEKSDRSQARIDSQNNHSILQQQVTQQATDSANNMTLMLQKMDQADRNSRLDRADRADARADELMFRREDQMRADRRYDRERRRESIAALTAGLASLGAAFAV